MPGGGGELEQAPPSTNPAELAQGVQAFRGYNQPQAPPPPPPPSQGMEMQSPNANPYSNMMAGGQALGGIANGMSGGMQKPQAPPGPSAMGMQGGGSNSPFGGMAKSLGSAMSPGGMKPPQLGGMGMQRPSRPQWGGAMPPRNTGFQRQPMFGRGQSGGF
jgi:hypothetical protein